MWRRAEIVTALLLALTLAPGVARGHEALSLEEEFVKGVFAPSFSPPPAGTYELPPLKRVPGFVLRDDTGHRVSTERLTAGEGGGAGEPGRPPLHQLRCWPRHPGHPCQVRAGVRRRSAPVAICHGAL